jgi:hypothetical protein
MGAWASHIFVDSQAAADYGREYWGLPATVVPIQFLSEEESSQGGAISFHGDDGIDIHGWEAAERIPCRLGSIL